MGDQYLNVGGIQGDYDQMTQATEKMVNAVTEFVGLVKANIDTFQGSASESFQATLQSLLNEVEEMHGNYGTGTTLLGEMSDQVLQADKQAASILGGS